MPQYLSDEWFKQMSEAGSVNPISSSGELALQEVVTDTPFGTVTYVLNIADGDITFVSGDGKADVTFTQNYETAVALHKGELTIHDAFFAGKVRVSGRLNMLLEHSDLLQGLAPAFDKVRADTTY